MNGFERDFLLFGHRGDPAHCPENTMASFAFALESGAHGIELDVTLSADGEVVVIHDETLDRTTDGAGRASAFPLAQLKQLDAGGWFGPEFSGQRLPTLAEVFAEFGHRCLINVEIKPEAACVRAAESIEQSVLALVRQYDLHESVLVSSFNYQSLLTLRDLDADLRLGVLCRGVEENIDFRSLVAAIEAWSFHIRAAELIADVAQIFAEDGVRVLCWAGSQVAEEPALRHALQCGANGFFANDPGLLKNILEN